jgi:hypothetical protein
MRPSLRHAILMILLVAFLIPGLVQARPVYGSSARLAAAGEVTHDTGFFSMVWNLLADLWSGRGLAGSLNLEKDTVPGTPSTATTPPPPPGDNGGRLDPAG